MASHSCLSPSRGLTVAAALLAAGTVSCSPGTLPGTPSRIEFGGGGGRYDGRIAYRRLSGNFILDESLQQMTMSLTLNADDQFTASFRSPNSTGTLSGTVNGALNNGTFTATVLVSVDAVQGSTASGSSSPTAAHGGAHPCEGRGQATGRFNGPNISWTIESITYTNCPGLNTSSEAEARAVSPVPARPQQAHVVITISPSTTIRRGTCFDGSSGFPFLAEVAETTGVSVTFDRTITVEERREGSNTVEISQLDNPLTTLPGGERRRFAGCGMRPGTYQAFLTGRDANGNAIRTATPLLTFIN